jgi:hypothetical protein
MKKITLNCPHCGKPFALADALTESAQEELAKHFNAPEAQLQLRQQIANEFGAEQRLRELEREKLIVDLRASVQALQIKLAVSSQQSAGDALEVELLDSLSRSFPHDLFERIGKGRNGGDLIHSVRNSSGETLGTILWEAKNTALWSAKWIEKIRGDARECKAQLSVIVSKSLPKPLATFGQVEEVWVCAISCYLGLATALPVRRFPWMRWCTSGLAG